MAGGCCIKVIFGLLLSLWTFLYQLCFIFKSFYCWVARLLWNCSVCGVGGGFMPKPLLLQPEISNCNDVQYRAYFIILNVWEYKKCYKYITSELLSISWGHVPSSLSLWLGECRHAPCQRNLCLVASSALQCFTLAANPLTPSPISLVLRTCNVFATPPLMCAPCSVIKHVLEWRQCRWDQGHLFLCLRHGLVCTWFLCASACSSASGTNWYLS